jgi:SET domain-containing protein
MTPTRKAKRPAAKSGQDDPRPARPRRSPSPQDRSAGSGRGGRSDAAAKPGGRRIQVRRSGIHGKGVFALQPIARGETIIEYLGRIVTWKQAQRQPPHDPSDPNHTFFFHIDERRVIDAAVGGNAARWINHACDPNCEADEVDGRIFIKALRDIRPGEELNYDYGLIIEERYTPKLKQEYACRCGARACRGTMLAPKR